jgi:hypothetical protein
MALSATVGGSTSNSYVTMTEANNYFANHYQTAKKTAWLALAQPQKESVLKRSCQQIETLRMLDDDLSTGRLPVELVVELGYDLVLHRAEIGQRLQLPRNIDLDPSTEAPFIPQEAKDAQCEQAIYLLSFDDTALVTTNSGIVEEAVTAGAVKSYTRYAEGFAPTYLSPMVIELLRPFLRVSGRLRRA